MKYNVPLFDREVRVFFGFDDYVKFCKKHNLEQDVTRTGGRAGFAGGMMIPINKNASISIFYMCILAKSIKYFSHELSHVCFDICGQQGIPVTEGEPNETYCYMYGKMMEDLYPYWLKFNKGK